MTKVPGEILTQKCSARNLYPMSVTWRESAFLFSIKVKTFSQKKQGLYYTMNSTITIGVSLLTPQSFKMWCRVITNYFIQQENFTSPHNLYQKTQIFPKPKSKSLYIYPNKVTVKIQRKDNIRFEFNCHYTTL